MLTSGKVGGQPAKRHAVHKRVIERYESQAELKEDPSESRVSFENVDIKLNFRLYTSQVTDSIGGKIASISTRSKAQGW